MNSESSPPDGVPSATQDEAGKKAAASANDSAPASVSKAPGVWDTSESDDEAESNGINETETESQAESPGKKTASARSTDPKREVEIDVVEIEADSIHPPPPRSQRPRTAKDSTAAPLGVTATLPPSSWPPRVVGDLMTRKLITMREDESIGDLEECMKRFRFHHLPVVTSAMKLVGLITRTDLLHAQLGVRPDGTSVPPVDSSTQAGDIMRRNVVVGKIEYSVTTACKVMLDNTLACLPVVQDDGTLIGMLTQTDFTRLALSLLEPKST